MRRGQRTGTRALLALAFVSVVGVGGVAFGVGYVLGQRSVVFDDVPEFLFATQPVSIRVDVPAERPIKVMENRVATTATTSIEAPKAPVPEPPVPPPTVQIGGVPPSGRWGVQLGAFETEDEARVFIRSNATALAGGPVFIIPAEIRGRGTWFRVRVGAERTKARAKNVQLGLPPELGKAALVVSHR